jgi:hypothetical protein
MPGATETGRVKRADHCLASIRAGHKIQSSCVVHFPAPGGA